MEVDLRSWWVLLKWVFEIECVRGNIIVWCVSEMQSMKQRRNRGRAMA